MFSIIIPSFNEEKYIGSLLQALMDHHQKDAFEVIVVDGGSSDDTVKKIKAFPVKLLHSKHASRAVQMNLGAKKAVGDILYFVHADVQLPHSFVDDIELAVRKGYKAGCYRFRFLHKPYKLLYIHDFFTRFPFLYCRGGDQTLFVTRRLFSDLGGFNEEFVIMEDYEFLNRIIRKKYFKIIPKSVGVSARKYERNSYLQVQIANVVAMAMYKRGKHPVIIKAYYESALT